MGGSVGNTIGRVGSGVLTLGGSEIARNNLPKNNIIRNALGAPGSILTGGMAAGDQMPALFGGGSGSNPYISGPFSLDPTQLANDQNSINDLGNKQYRQTQDFINSDVANRTSARQALSDALTKQAQTSFQQSLPGTEETLNAQHLLNGSGLGQEIARQQGNLAANIANQVGVQGAEDINTASSQRGAALQGLQGFQTGALQRGQSLEDFINQANVAKTIGAQMAPQPPSSKQNFGTVAQGAGALAPWAKVGKAAV